MNSWSSLSPSSAPPLPAPKSIFSKNRNCFRGHNSPGELWRLLQNLILNKLK